MATRVDDRIGEVIDGRYRLLSVIGRGASSQVYLAHAIRLRRHVAVKILRAGLVDDPRFLHQFAQEGEVIARLSHDHIVIVYDSGDTGSGPYLVTEYMAGGSLGDLLTAGRRLTPPQAVSIGAQAASGLAAAHAAELVHRDVKPANLLFTADGRLKIADFGVAQALSHSARTEPDGFSPATIRYASPDRLGSGRSDPRTDVYSLCVTLVESVTGMVPLMGSDASETLWRRRDVAVPVPASFGPAREVLLHAGAPQPDDRPSATELEAALDDAAALATRIDPLPLMGAVDVAAFADSDATDLVLTPPGIDGSPPTLVEAATHRAEQRRARRRRWRWRVGVAAVLALMTLATVWAVTSVQEAGVATARVAEYVGLPIEDVRSRADDAGWVLGEREVRDDDTPLGTVVAQIPAAGSELEVGSTVTVDVVQGRFLVLVPRLAGLDVNAATERVTARGFDVAEQVRQYDETIPSGVVIEALIDGAVEPGMSLRERGTPVAMVISDGPTPRVVPKVEGLTVEAATGALAAEQLRLQVEAEEFSDTVAAGLIIRQAVPADARVDRDSVVLVVVSKGPDLRIVPDLRGMTLDQATAQLAAVGLNRGPVEGSGPIVQFTEPVAGTALPPGTEVSLFTPAPAPAAPAP